MLRVAVVVRVVRRGGARVCVVGFDCPRHVRGTAVACSPQTGWRSAHGGSAVARVGVGHAGCPAPSPAPSPRLCSSGAHRATVGKPNRRGACASFCTTLRLLAGAGTCGAVGCEASFFFFECYSVRVVRRVGVPAEPPTCFSLICLRCHTLYCRTTHSGYPPQVCACVRAALRSPCALDMADVAVSVSSTWRTMSR